MTTQTRSTVYGSPMQFDENRIGAAAVYCCDGRFGEHFDDFLHNALKLPRYDRLALPGGPGCLAGHFLASKEEESLIAQLRFLIRAHGIERVVLIAHQGCAFYLHQLHLSPEKVEAQQREDMAAAVQRINSIARGLRVDTFFARKSPDGTIQFEPME